MSIFKSMITDGHSWIVPTLKIYIRNNTQLVYLSARSKCKKMWVKYYALDTCTGQQYLSLSQALPPSVITYTSWQQRTENKGISPHFPLTNQPHTQCHLSCTTSIHPHYFMLKVQLTTWIRGTGKEMAWPIPITCRCQTCFHIHWYTIDWDVPHYLTQRDFSDHL